MNLYLIKCKVEKIKQARDDFYKWKGIEVNPFTKKIFFYFFEHDNIKYIHKPSLEFVYTNADTYTYDVDPTHCNLTKGFEIEDLYPFLISGVELLPNLVEYNEDFVAFEYYEGEPVLDISKEEFYYLKEKTLDMEYTPFYNSMTYNLVRGEEIKIVDFKHFERKDDKPFFVYFYNKENNINRLYIERDDDSVIKHLQIDYPIEEAEIIYY